jgi:lysophospholipase L1-like esterase
MKRLLYGLLFCLLGHSLSLADSSVIWPLPPPVQGVNSAITPTPQLGWFLHFQFNMTTAAKMPKVDLIFDGDSITDFWMNKGKAIWNQRYAKLNAYDFGISGDRTENVLWRLQNGQVNTLHPKLIALMIGTNNLAVNTPPQIAEGVKAIVNEYRQRCPDSIILLQAVFPRGAKSDDPLRQKIKDINQIISQLGDGDKIVYMDFGDKFLAPDGSLSSDIMPDFLHPSDKGYQIWADAIQPEIDKILPHATP